MLREGGRTWKCHDGISCVEEDFLDLLCSKKDVGTPGAGYGGLL
jgi:hypothetical protein